MKIANKEMKIIKKFKSKRNKVFLLKTENGNKYVFKKYREKKFLEREFEIIKKLFQKGINVPEVIYKSNDYILLEYIEGETLLSFILKKEREKADYEELNKIFQEIYSWLDGFYYVFKEDGENLIKGDVNLRNFILKNINKSKPKIYGLDFENPKVGNKEEDIGKICAFTVCYAPEFSKWKKGLAKKFFEFMNFNLDLDPELTYGYYHKELNSIKKRRNLKIKDEIYEILT